NYVIIRLRLLQHEPHSLYVVSSKSPIALRIQISEIQLLLEPVFDAPHRARHFACDEGFAALWRLVIEQYPVADEHSVRLPVVDGVPVCCNLACCVWAAWMKWSLLV